MSQIEEVYLSADAFKNMNNLKSLKFYSTTGKSSVKLPSGLDSFCEGLRYFYWDLFPLESLPASTFCPQSLLEIHMRYSHVTKLWDGVQVYTHKTFLMVTSKVLASSFHDFSYCYRIM